ncbi:MAG: hypothetical protein HFJ66_05815 [Eggerthellaceae bacterium]|nr:hypothetical protein [Eggerthellaceae bacterium]
MPALNYTLPDFTAHLGLNLFFARVLVEHPGWGRPGARIESIYGNFPGCRLNGGRAYLREPFTPQQINWTFSVLAEYGIQPRLTLTNMQATVQELDGPYARIILEAAARAGAGAIVYNEELGREVQRRYGLPLTLSTTVPLETTAQLNQKLRDYDYVVLDYNRHKDEDYLQAIERPEKAELMVNEFCVKGCPHRQEHYRHNSEDQQQGQLRPFPCRSNRPDFFDHKPGHPVQFTADEVDAVAQRHSISQFKIVGRGAPTATLAEACLHYLIKPEANETVRALLAQATSR